MVSIVWTRTAKESLKLIFDFYSEIADKRVASKVIQKITEDVGSLQKGTFTTSKEPILAEFDRDYRYLVSGNFKNIYFRVKNEVVVSLVFDARQNPEKMKALL